MTFFTELADTAMELLEELGEDVAVNRPQASAYDATSRTVGAAPAPTTQTLRGTFEPGGVSRFAEGLAAKFERILVAAPAAGGFDPQPGDVVIGDGSTWTAGDEQGEGVQIERRQGVVLLYIVGLTRR